jgi:hypothetical protein
MTFRWWRAGLAVSLRPTLWGIALSQVVRLARPGWWKRAPFLPVPDAEYLRFRLVTAYGDPNRAPDPADVVTYLHWCRAWPRVVQ